MADRIDLEGFSLERFFPLSDERIDEHADVINSIMAPCYTLGDINIDRNTFVYWLKKGLIPNQSPVANGWRRFSFIECIWLKVIVELRALGISVGKIHDLKDVLFDSELFFEEIKKRMGSPEMAHLSSPEIIEVITSAEYEEYAEIKGENDSLFASLVFAALLEKRGFGICISSEGAYAFPSLGNTAGIEEPLDYVTEVETLLSGSFIQVNIWPLIMDLLFVDGIEVSSELEVSVLTKEEKHLLGAIRSGKYAEILVALDQDGSIDQLKLFKNGVTKEAIRKVHQFLKREKYENIQFKTKNGQLISYSEAEVINFKKEKR